jgi:hypothetical protein
VSRSGQAGPRGCNRKATVSASEADLADAVTSHLIASGSQRALSMAFVTVRSNQCPHRRLHTALSPVRPSGLAFRSLPLKLSRRFSPAISARTRMRLRSLRQKRGLCRRDHSSIDSMRRGLEDPSRRFRRTLVQFVGDSGQRHHGCAAHGPHGSRLDVEDLLDRNRLVWMAEVNGLLVDLRDMPRERFGLQLCLDLPCVLIRQRAVATGIGVRFVSPSWPNCRYVVHRIPLVAEDHSGQD